MILKVAVSFPVDTPPRNMVFDSVDKVAGTEVPALPERCSFTTSRGRELPSNDEKFASVDLTDIW